MVSLFVCSARGSWSCRCADTGAAARAIRVGDGEFGPRAVLDLGRERLPKAEPKGLARSLAAAGTSESSKS